MGRPPLTEEQVRARVAAYCQRYHVSPGPGGLPPFPTGRRETRQHREWLTVYRALQRAKARAAAAASVPAETPAGGSCPVCGRPLREDLAVVRARRAGEQQPPVSLHPTCAELVRLADTVGPQTLARVASFLWPGRARTTASPRPPRG